jgi:hypothetical protein
MVYENRYVIQLRKTIMKVIRINCKANRDERINNQDLGRTIDKERVIVTKAVIQELTNQDDDMK